MPAITTMPPTICSQLGSMPISAATPIAKTGAEFENSDDVTVETIVHAIADTEAA